MPLFTSLLGFIFLKERITKAEILCLFLAFFGVYILLFNGKTAQEEKGSKSNI
jgi:drug/metabolite transporter (DMT)-like permease